MCERRSAKSQAVLIIFGKVLMMLEKDFEKIKIFCLHSSGMELTPTMLCVLKSFIYFSRVFQCHKDFLFSHVYEE
jgi:hypothetical protein